MKLFGFQSFGQIITTKVWRWKLQQRFDVVFCSGGLQRGLWCYNNNNGEVNLNRN